MSSSYQMPYMHGLSDARDKVWVPHKFHVWSLGYVVERTLRDGNFFVSIEYEEDKGKGNVHIFPEDSIDTFHSSHMENIHDLCSMQDLFSGPILHLFRRRFFDNVCITRVGPMLVSINPYKNINGATVGDIMQRKSEEAYTTVSIYDIAYDALRQLLNSYSVSIVICGVSGSGKSYAARNVCEFLVAANNLYSQKSSGGNQPVDSYDRLEQYCTHTDVIINAFGCSRTLQNNMASRCSVLTCFFYENSSSSFRFPSSVEALRIKSICTNVMLLEKCHVSNKFRSDRSSGNDRAFTDSDRQRCGERNFHIFYYLIRGTDISLNKDMLKLWSVDQFSLLTDDDINELDECLAEELIDSLAEAEHDNLQFSQLCNSFRELGLTVEEMSSLWSIVAAILHLGNITFEHVDENNRNRSTSGGVKLLSGIPLKQLCSLVGVDSMAFQEALSGGVGGVSCESVARHRLVNLIKYLYYGLFQLVVGYVNACAPPMGEQLKGRKYQCISVFDVHGFHALTPVNSLDLFINNYFGAMIHSHYYEFILYNESVRYNELDAPLPYDIITPHVVYEIFKVIDGVCDTSTKIDMEEFTSRMDSQLSKSSSTSPLCAGTSKTPFPTFTISHFGGEVTYDAHDLVTSNYNDVSDQLLALLRASDNTVMRKLIHVMETVGPGAYDNKGCSSVVTSAKKDIAKVSDILNSSNSLYIKCIKPNKNQQNGQISLPYVNDQLKNSGVFEAKRLFCERKLEMEHFPVMLSVDAFACAYYMFSVSMTGTDRCSRLAVPGIIASFVQSSCLTIEDYRLYRDHIYLADGVVDQLNALKARRLSKAVVYLQAHARRCFKQQAYLYLRKSCLLLQSCVRMWCCYGRYYWTKVAVITLQRRLRFWIMQKSNRKHNGAIVIQRVYRGTYCRGAVFVLCMSVVKLQAFARQLVSMRRYNESLNAILMLQCLARRVLAQNCYRVRLSAVVQLQAFGRMIIAIGRHDEALLAVSTLQSFARKCIAVTTARTRLCAVIQLQAFGRMVIALDSYQSAVCCVITLQSHVRCLLAKLLCRDLRSRNSVS